MRINKFILSSVGLKFEMIVCRISFKAYALCIYSKVIPKIIILGTLGPFRCCYGKTPASIAHSARNCWKQHMDYSCLCLVHTVLLLAMRITLGDKGKVRAAA